jgi:prepilin-type N-terminal cleavage/methylation domain-containing protein
LPNAILTSFSAKIQRLSENNFDGWILAAFSRTMDILYASRLGWDRAILPGGGISGKGFRRHSQRNCSMHRFKSGFTLVELLVVITIIGLLIAMLIPAVSMIRERGRQTACMSNQHQIGFAIQEYEATNKQQLPGLMNVTAGGTQFSWVEAISPNLEHTDIWENIRAGKANAITGVRINSTICPDDPYLADPTSPNAQMLLSYGVNDQYFVDYRGKPYNPNYAPPVGRNFVSSSSASFNTFAPAIDTNLKTRPYGTFPHGQTATTTQTVMLGERTFPDTTTYSLTRAGQWGDPGAGSPNPWSNPSWTYQKFWQALAFPCPSPSSPSVPISPQVMASSHGSTVVRNSSGIVGTAAGTVVIVTYFDGHGAILPSDTQFP